MSGKQQENRIGTRASSRVRFDLLRLSAVRAVVRSAVSRTIPRYSSHYFSVPRSSLG